ncbi:MAG: 3-deoxy-8-phosphooctulonate synthase [Puniceicoccales bacterium]|jgi:2-dehydro-3-deoxyphosphooctonate aldolase (KDO 8-P synthase)|nr:3-deoxy-8-phosphooctulonate synthase [Puniceicoccales bacterium]
MIHDPKKLLLIAGPCSLENETICRAVAEQLASLKEKFAELNIVFKGSYDKANRTSLRSGRGPGIDQGLDLLALVKREYHLPVVTDVHEPVQCAQVAAVVDVLQIPAFLCRQTDLLAAAARTGHTVNVKKGQFLSPREMTFVTSKLRESGAAEVWQTERGTTFGYQNLIVDMRSFNIMERNGYPTVMDATHSVQLPGASSGTSSGQREFVPLLAKAALAAGADGLFLETHPEPARAISDAESQLPLADLPALVETCLRVWRAVRE